MDGTIKKTSVDPSNRENPVSFAESTVGSQ